MTLERILERVEKTPTCWIWKGAVAKSGYGAVNMRGRVMTVHRAVYTLIHGELPPSVHVCHTCDVRLCCRPEHLFAGTTADNNADMAAKGRARNKPRFGADHPLATLTPADAKAILHRHAAGTSQSQLAREFRVDHRVIWNIVHGRHWTVREALCR